jgi:hypothetical protein
LARIVRFRQIDFVDRPRRGTLPVSKRSQELVCDILPVTKSGDSIIRAKSGLLGAEIAGAAMPQRYRRDLIRFDLPFGWRATRSWISFS